MTTTQCLCGGTKKELKAQVFDPRDFFGNVQGEAQVWVCTACHELTLCDEQTCSTWEAEVVA